MSFCKSCGKELIGDTRFCQNCGSPTTTPGGLSVVGAEVNAAAAPSTPAAVQPQAASTNVIGALAYLAGFITGIIFLVIDPYKNNSFVRFHAFQSIFFNIAWIGLWIAWTIVSIILSTITRGLFGLISLPVSLLFSFVGFALWLFLMYQAYQEKLFKLPIVGKFAAQYAGVKP